MNSPSVTGAYCFVIEPGANTVVEVEASLFFRKGPKKIGLAPLGSLFLAGQNRTRFISDYLPQVHDSDGLLIESGDGNWMWRLLVNPAKEHQISRFPLAELKGFGLMHRDREFPDYDDLGSRFERRPSYWGEPGGHWGPGTIELVEIPTPTDWNDNIVAYSRSQAVPAPGQELHLTYRLSALLAGPEQVPLLRVRSTRIRPESGDSPPRFVIDFAGTTTCLTCPRSKQASWSCVQNQPIPAKSANSSKRCLRSPRPGSICICHGKWPRVCHALWCWTASGCARFWPIWWATPSNSPIRGALNCISDGKTRFPANC
jgi:glucan biosynthesis protein